jgi:hypothetical protein
MAKKDSPESIGSQKQMAARLIWDGVLAGLNHPGAAGRLAACLTNPIAWAEVVAEARRARVTPALYAGLKAAGDGAVPRSVLDALRSATLAAGARSARLERAAAAALAAASNAGIPLLVLKGLALQSLAYPAGVVRVMDDVDVLVSPAHRPHLTDLLRCHGYRDDVRGEEDFFAPDLSYSIDVHTHVVNTTRLPARAALWPETFDEIWRRRQPFRLSGVPAWTLGAQDTVQHLAVHAVHHHGMQGVLWMADLVAAMRTWPDALGGVRDAPSGVRRSTWCCLAVLAARGEESASAPAAALRPRRRFPGERRLLTSAARDQAGSHVRYAFTLACLPRWSDRAAFIRQMIFPSEPVYTRAFGDAGPPPPGGWLTHWRHAARLVVGGLVRRRPQARGPQT